ncbi:MAG: hypothetical protein J7499_10775 [Sphingopyxis sp.]|nr:hypothetical protein [Sphingopyxis sp.]
MTAVTAIARAPRNIGAEPEPEPEPEERTTVRHLFAAIAAILLLAPATGDARLVPLPGAPPSATPEPRMRWRHSCTVERKLRAGSVSLTRLYTEAGKRDAGDFMRWNLAGYDPSSPRRPLEPELSFIWDAARRPAIEPRKIELRLRVGLDADLPEVALIRMQRPFPVEPHGIIGSTALSTHIFPYGAHDLGNGHGELPLGDLLAYAGGYDALDWTLVRPSDRLGGERELARGTIDIAALREAVAALPALRSALAGKTARPGLCDRIPWPDDILH